MSFIPRKAAVHPFTGMHYDEIRRTVAHLMVSRGEYAGAPIPVDGLTLRIEPGFSEKYPGLEGEWPKRKSAARDTINPATGEREWIVNEWVSRKWQCRVMLVRTERGTTWKAMIPYVRPLQILELMANSLSACTAHDLDCELTAMETLAQHITPYRFTQYQLLGYFGERSQKSGVLYLFRRARPTIALGPTGRALCALCMHPIAYYDRSFVGAMTPTDDVLAHLLLMRADEHMLWRRCNQHPIDTPNAGV